MKKNLIRTSICQGICLLIMTVFIFGVTSCNPKNTNTQNVTVTPCETELASVQAQNADLRIDTARLGEQVRCWESKFPNYKGEICGKVKKTTVRRTAIETTQPQTQSTQRIATAELAPQKTEIVQSSRRSTDNLSYLRDQNGKILFCVQANGREDLYFPDFAIQHGVTFSNFKDNQQKGYNFDVEPSPDYKGDYGVTDAGVFYISNPLIESSLQKESISLQYLSIKCPYTGWKNVRMIQEGDRWIFQTTPR